MDAKRFRVALSFSGDERPYVSEVAGHLADHFGGDKVFYDKNYRAELARRDMDLYLQKIYREQADIIALFSSGSYNTKYWTSIEGRAIRDLLNQRSENIVLVKMDDAASPDGFFPFDGYLPAETLSPREVAEDIITRYNLQFDQLQTSIAAPSPATVPVPEPAAPPVKPTLLSPLFRSSPLAAGYLFYISRDRLAGLFQQVDVNTLSLMAETRSPLLEFSPPEEYVAGEKAGRPTVRQLAAVLRYLEETARIGDLNAIVKERGELSADWYQVEALFTTEPWRPDKFTVKLTGKIEEYELVLNCAARNISGIIEERGNLFPTSASYLLFEGVAPLLLKGLVRLGAFQREKKLLQGSALYLILQPLNDHL